MSWPRYFQTFFFQSLQTVKQKSAETDESSCVVWLMGCLAVRRHAVNRSDFVLPSNIDSPNSELPWILPITSQINSTARSILSVPKYSYQGFSSFNDNPQLELLEWFIFSKKRMDLKWIFCTGQRRNNQKYCRRVRCHHSSKNTGPTHPITSIHPTSILTKFARKDSTCHR